VTEVKDVSRLGSRPREDLTSRLDAELLAAQTTGGIEVALHGPVARTTPALVKVHVPVNTDDRRTGARHEVEEFAGTDAKEDGRDIEVVNTVEDRLGGAKGESLVLVARQRARPGIKELERSRAVSDLQSEKSNRDGDQAIKETIKESGI
jgi:hypothetical protein